ncbi:MAG: hypothetical protein PVI86_19250 [Phycisphaerae bacterium]
MRSGKGVITWASVPFELGIDSDPTVQAWIGANRYTGGSSQIVTTAVDPVLGDLPIGTVLSDCAASVCPALADTSGHPHAKVLAELDAIDGGPDAFAILRNYWQGGQSVYLTEYINPGSPQDDQIILNAVRELSRGPVPAVSHWGLAALGLLTLAAGSVLIRGRNRLRVA